MNEQKPRPRSPEDEDVFYLLSCLVEFPSLTQRELSRKLKISLGKTNYLIHSLIARKCVEVKNATGRRNKGKERKYILTQEGRNMILYLTRHYLRLKQIEYTLLRRKWKALLSEENAAISQRIAANSVYR